MSTALPAAGTSPAAASVTSPDQITPSETDRSRLQTFVHSGCELVERHGGRIWDSSPEGRGASLSLPLPLAAIADPEGKQGCTRQRACVMPPRGPGTSDQTPDAHGGNPVRCLPKGLQRSHERCCPISELWLHPAGRAALDRHTAAEVAEDGSHLPR